jgi:hypothetical protein
VAQLGWPFPKLVDLVARARRKGAVCRQVIGDNAKRCWPS